jgi:hypothetical protein
LVTTHDTRKAAPVFIAKSIIIMTLKKGKSRTKTPGQSAGIKLYEKDIRTFVYCSIIGRVMAGHGAGRLEKRRR